MPSGRISVHIDIPLSFPVTMIEFTCSCGKKYRLPARNAGREVRCNQCEKTLIVPQQSQTELIVPVGEQPTPFVEAKVESKTDQSPELSAAVPQQSTPEKSTGIEHKSLDAAVTSPFTEVPSPSTPNDQATESTPSDHPVGFSLGILTAMLVSSLVAAVVCFVVGRFSVGTPPPQIEYVETVVIAPPSAKPTTADDWTIAEETLPLFEIRTADGAPATLSLDGDPTTAKTGIQSALDQLTVALDDDQAIKGTETHTTSLRIESESGEELCVVWPESRNAGLDEADIKELKFCVYFGSKVELADFRLRIGDAFGDTEFVLTEQERINLCEKGRITWFAVSVPIDGNDRWQRTERGRMTPKTVDFIEFRAKPSGNGVTFWIDNLKIVR